MKYIKTIFIVIVCVVLCLITWNVSQKYTAKQYETRIADLHAFQNAETIRLNTKIEKGRNELIKQDKLIARLKKSLTDALEEVDLVTLQLATYDKDDEIYPADEYIEFVPDIPLTPETIIEYVEKEISIVDSCEYLYQDKNNGYTAEINVKYESKDGLFYFVPQNVYFEAQKPIVRKNNTVSLLYFADNSGGIMIQNRVLPFVTIGGFVGVTDKFIVGVNLGYSF